MRYDFFKPHFISVVWKKSISVFFYIFWLSDCIGGGGSLWSRTVQMAFHQEWSRDWTLWVSVSSPVKEDGKSSDFMGFQEQWKFWLTWCMSSLYISYPNMGFPPQALDFRGLHSGLPIAVFFPTKQGIKSEKWRDGKEVNTSPPPPPTPGLPSWTSSEHQEL